ncbi:hypothetical protein RJ640_007467 [Escallonia rubra]|uniref:Bet v I/Major latex protein domain-containing protein n=1 Tax=Escallonia rubra TaxID=112253 RepID=A0AA88R1C0_9ASTE|nr:hypothetical protein RJ640_007467 [Escallonia rubra]
MKTYGSVATEMEIQAPARKAWALYGTVDLTVVTVPKYLAAVDIVEGDGGEGSIAKLTPLTGTTFTLSRLDIRFSFIPRVVLNSCLGCLYRQKCSPFYEKFTKVDNKHMVKETEITQGGFLDLGFTLYRIRFENIPTGKKSCITRTTIEYEVKEEFVANLSRVSILPSINIAKDIEAYLLAHQEHEDCE